MSLTELAAFAAGVPLLVLVWWGLVETGRIAVRILRLQPAHPDTAHFVAGLALVYLASFGLSAAGAFRPLPLALIVAGAGLAAVPRRIGQLRRRPFHVPDLTPTPLYLALGLVALTYLVMTLTPVVHYDLTANYLAVARDFLARGSVAPLPGNVHSGTSTFLHVFLAIVLAVGRPLNTSVFALADPHLYSLVVAGAVLLTGERLRRLAELVVQRQEDAHAAWSYGLLLWLVMPQTLLLFALKYTEFITTALVVSAVVLVLETDLSEADSAILGVVLGLIVAAKLQLAPVALALALVAVFRRPRHLPHVAIGAVLLASPSVLRSLAAYGVPLYPYTPGTGVAAHAARSLLAENGGGLPGGAAELIARLAHLVTRQPETGFTLLLALPAVLRWRRRPGLAVVTLLPLAAVAVATTQSVAGLRWLQYLVPVVLVTAGAALAPYVRRSLWWWSLLLLVATSSVLALGFTGRVIGLTDHLRMRSADWIARFDNTFAVRQRLAATHSRTLWAGFGETFYTSLDDVATSVHDGAALAAWLSAPRPGELARRLTEAGIDTVAWDHRHDRDLRRSEGYWWWVTGPQRAVILRFLAQQDIMLQQGRVTVYRVSGEITGPGSPPSPP